jgi:hypothetical protein
MKPVQYQIYSYSFKIISNHFIKLGGLYNQCSKIFVKRIDTLHDFRGPGMIHERVAATVNNF